MKVPLFPFHTWLPDAYEAAPTSVSMILTGLLSKMGVYGFIRLLLPLFPREIQILGPWLLGLAVCSIVFSALAAWAQTDLKRMVAYLSINHLGYCLLAIFAIGANAAPSLADTQAALSGVFLQIFNHGLTAAALFYFVGLLEQRRGARGLGDFGGLMQRTPLLCGWMSVAMFSSLGLPGLNGFVGEFLIFKGSFALAPAFTAVAVLGLLFTAITFLRAMQSLFSGPLARKLRGVSRSHARRECWSSSRSRCSCSRSASRRNCSSTSSMPPSRRWRGFLSDEEGRNRCVGKIAQTILIVRGEKVLLDADLAQLYGVTTANLNKAVKRNRDRFPKDFMFRLTAAEAESLIFQFGISSWGESSRTALRLHRAGRRHALQRPAQRARGEGEHRDHARLRALARPCWKRIANSRGSSPNSKAGSANTTKRSPPSSMPSGN